jgi:hypothetical protein
VARCKLYKLALATHHERAYTALTKICDHFRHVFQRLEVTYADGVVPLSQTLKLMARFWSQSKHLTGLCPVIFTPENEHANKAQARRYID